MPRAAVLGSPIAHSLSPVIHNAGYAAAGLTDWVYTAHECTEPELADFVSGMDDEWAGLSLTMPLKRVALDVADEVTPIARALGAANTLVRRDGHGIADNTDAGGMTDALTDAGVPRAGAVAILGAGGTARAALGAAADLSAVDVVVYARRRSAFDELTGVADRLNLSIRYAPWETVAEAGHADVVVSTTPKGVADDLPVAWRPGTVLFDVCYDPWPTPLAAAASRAGARIVDGLALLLAQAVRQFRLFTGVEPPVSAMRDALYRAVSR